MVIKKKCWPEYFDAIASGKKKFEFRLADFEINDGDTLILQEYDPKTKTYTGRSAETTVTYVGKKTNPRDWTYNWTPEQIEKYGFYILSIDLKK